MTVWGKNPPKAQTLVFEELQFNGKSLGGGALIRDWTYQDQFQ